MFSIEVSKSTKHDPIRCKYCGKFIAMSEIGKTARKESDRYFAEFVHDECRDKILTRIHDMCQPPREEK